MNYHYYRNKINEEMIKRFFIKFTVLLPRSISPLKYLSDFLYTFFSFVALVVRCQFVSYYFQCVSLDVSNGFHFYVSRSQIQITSE